MIRFMISELQPNASEGTGRDTHQPHLMSVMMSEMASVSTCTFSNFIPRLGKRENERVKWVNTYSNDLLLLLIKHSTGFPGGVVSPTSARGSRRRHMWGLGCCKGGLVSDRNRRLSFHARLGPPNWWWPGQEGGESVMLESAGRSEVTFRQMDVTQRNLQAPLGDFRVSHQLLIHDETWR